MPEDFIRFSCDQCGRHLKAPADATGKRTRCPKCGSSNSIPAKGGEVLDLKEMSSSLLVAKKNPKLPAMRQPPPLPPERNLKEKPISAFEPFEEIEKVLLEPIQAPIPQAPPLTNAQKPCPYCAEMILAQATKCRFCGEFLDGAGRRTEYGKEGVAINVAPTNVVTVHNVVSTGSQKWNPVVAAILSLFIPGLGQLYKGQLLNGILWFFVVFIGYLFVFPGLILHLCCIIGAASGDPYR